MSFYQTCRNCALERMPCARRAAVAAGIKGIGLTAVKFRCDQRQPLYRPGQRVAVTWHYYPPEWSHEEQSSLETWPATVAHETKKGFLIAVDDVPSDQCEVPAREYIKNENLFCNVTANKLSALEEPDRPVCKYCRNPGDGKGGVAGFCWGEDGEGALVTPDCLASVDRSPQGEKPQALSVQHESAVGAAETPNLDQQSNQLPDGG